MRLWERTKLIARMYTGTFIVVMLLNQLLFFGFCLNPICIVAAMPHVLAITVFLGSWLNRESGWGDDTKSGNVGKILKESKTIINNTIEETAAELKKINESDGVENKGVSNVNPVMPDDVIKSKGVELPVAKEVGKTSFVKKISNTVYSTCPKCGSNTILRTAKTGYYAGRQFYGCSRYPQCKGIINLS